MLYHLKMDTTTEDFSELILAHGETRPSPIGETLVLPRVEPEDISPLFAGWVTKPV